MPIPTTERRKLIAYEKKVQELVDLSARGIAYNETAKHQYHRLGKAVLKILAEKLGYQPGDYDLRSNLGGIAVSGEITLHSDALYVRLSVNSVVESYCGFWRTCQGRKDYVGGPNQWFRFSDLREGELRQLAARMLNRSRELDINARFAALCGEHLIDFGVAMENEDFAAAYRWGNLAAAEKVLNEQF